MNLPLLTVKGFFEEVKKKMQSCRCDLNTVSQLSPPATIAESQSTRALSHSHEWLTHVLDGKSENDASEGTS